MGAQETKHWPHYIKEPTEVYRIWPRNNTKNFHLNFADCEDSHETLNFTFIFQDFVFIFSFSVKTNTSTDSYFFPVLIRLFDIRLCYCESGSFFYSQVSVKNMSCGERSPLLIELHQTMILANVCLNQKDVNKTHCCFSVEHLFFLKVTAWGGLMSKFE